MNKYIALLTVIALPVMAAPETKAPVPKAPEPSYLDILNGASLSGYGTVDWAKVDGKPRTGAGALGSLRLGEHVSGTLFGETDNAGGAYLVDRLGGGLEYSGSFNKWLEGFGRFQLGYNFESAPAYLPETFFARPEVGLRANLINSGNFRLFVGPSYGWDIALTGSKRGQSSTAVSRLFFGGGLSYKF